MDDDKKYLNFDAINNEFEDFYNNFDTLIKFNQEQKDRFFRDNEKLISRLIVLAHDNRGEMHVYYALLSLSFELLTKLCVLKINWENYLKDYQKYGKNTISYGNSLLLKDLKEILNEPQYLRVKQISRIIKKQRDNFLHSPFKKMGHYAIDSEIFRYAALLISIYKFSLSEKVKSIIILNTERNDIYYGMDFKDVGLNEYVKKLV